MSEKKTEQAMRLFEAMEGVDPELLARSEKENKVLPFQRYARVMKTMAACLALIVVSGTCFVLLQNGGGQKAKNESAMAPMSDGAMRSGASSDSAKNAQEEQSDWNGIQAAFDEPTAKGEATFEAEANQDAAYEDGIWTDSVTHENADGSKEQASGGAQMNLIPTESSEGTKAQASQSTSGAESKEGLEDLEKSLISILKTRGKGTYAIRSLNQLKGTEISIDGGEAVRVDSAKAAELLMLVSDLELAPTGEQTLTEYVECGLCDDDGVVSSWFRIGGKYLQVVGTDEFYEILNEDFNYDTWRAGIEAALQEE